ncbi:DUF5694 domain-containing protein [Marilutibacter alkalisoli]|uniref:Uncharacterized protein n=1 Tax=Marilutibacter alkalisoli TaxID=2591633 RepID=A0A514BVQ5_9GAMM|nr:DUF5694 domain-containing protein [Lysobacter alkalisoli]QDH71478.1 hypothetical protein FKV23_16310 [Lysobacter alkalisoli]
MTATAWLALTGTAMAQVDLSTLDEGLSGAPTRVMVLGSVHLAQDGPERFDASALEPLLQRLVSFRPQIITIEAMPGETCDLMARHPATYDSDPENLDRFCPDTAAAMAATGMDVPAAIAEVDRLLASWPDAPSPVQRRQLAAAMLAAGDPTSALVQWWHLPVAERVAGDGLDVALVEALRKRASSLNENTRIGATLAVRLGLQRVFPVDDHTGDALRIDDMDGFAKAIRGAWDGAREQCAPSRELADALRESGDLLALYRHINGAEYQRATVACDFGAAQKEGSAQRFGRQYVAGWDLRNLRMVANIGATFRERPGARVLSIAGVSHKPWFDTLLGHMQGVEVVDVLPALE